MMSDNLIARIEQRIGNIPAHNPGVIDLYPTTLRQQISRELLRKIAEEAAAEARSPASKEGAEG